MSAISRNSTSQILINQVQEKNHQLLQLQVEIDSLKKSREETDREIEIRRIFDPAADIQESDISLENERLKNDLNQVKYSSTLVLL